MDLEPAAAPHLPCKRDQRRCKPPTPADSRGSASEKRGQEEQEARCKNKTVQNAPRPSFTPILLWPSEGMLLAKVPNRVSQTSCQHQQHAKAKAWWAWRRCRFLIFFRCENCFLELVCRFRKQRYTTDRPKRSPSVLHCYGVLACFSPPKGCFLPRSPSRVS